MIYNITKKNIISKYPRFIVGGSSFNIILKKKILFDVNDSLILQNKCYLYLFFLKLDIDILLLNIENRVIISLPLYKNRKLYLGSKNTNIFVLLPKSTANKYSIDVGDQLHINCQLTSEAEQELHNAINRPPL